MAFVEAAIVLQTSLAKHGILLRCTKLKSFTCACVYTCRCVQRRRHHICHGGGGGGWNSEVAGHSPPQCHLQYFTPFIMHMYMCVHTNKSHFDQCSVAIYDYMHRYFRCVHCGLWSNIHLCNLLDLKNIACCPSYKRCGWYPMASLSSWHWEPSNKGSFVVILRIIRKYWQNQ